MKDFLIVLEFELMTYFRKKAFIISTLIISLLIIAIVLLPNIRESFFPTSFEEDSQATNFNLGLVDPDNIMAEEIRTSIFGDNLNVYHSLNELEEDVNSELLDAGFVINSPLDYDYIIKTNEMFDSKGFIIEQAMVTNYQIIESVNRGIDYGQIADLIQPEFTSEIRILGTDSASNYGYTYVLVFVLYFIVIIYGQIVAASVASEKSNRTMELLVTSTNTTNLIFGKIISGALAGIIQFGIIIATGLIGLRLNHGAWEGSADFIFEIPADVLISFAVFGIMGYLFYAFMFGALGALVSRTEDVNTSQTPVTMLLVAVFMIAVFGMYNTSGLLLKVASFVPFSSFMAMFVRITMGTVTTIELIISFLILLVSTIIIGILASKIYRAGTLMYGNRVKIKDAFKLLKNN